MKSTEGTTAVLYAVDPYLDQVRVRTERRYCQIMKRFDAEYFETESAAKKFIIERAMARVLKAEDELRKAKDRHRKCLRRFK